MAYNLKSRDWKIQIYTGEGVEYMEFDHYYKYAVFVTECKRKYMRNLNSRNTMRFKAWG